LQDLNLADDASTPQQKSEYLGQFIDRMQSKSLPEYAAWIWKNDRNKVSNQMKVVMSLKKRCDDLAKVDPGSLGYAQGMQQISGQEFDHALGPIRDTFDDALSVQRGWFTFYGWSVAAIFVIIFGIAVLPRS